VKKILVLLTLFVAAPALAAFIDYNRSVTYTDNTAIPAAKIPTIQYQGHYGPAVTGPWTSGNTVTDNLAISAPDPPAGATWWYTVTATLDGMTSDKAAAKSKTIPFQTPAVDQVRGVR
jgi:hypothetical protein